MKMNRLEGKYENPNKHYYEKIYRQYREENYLKDSILLLIMRLYARDSLAFIFLLLLNSFD